MAAGMEDVLDGIDEPICVFDGAGGLVVHANAAFLRLAGLSSSERSPRHWRAWLASNYAEALAALEAAVADKRRHSVIIKHGQAGAAATGQLRLSVSPLASGALFMMRVQPLAVEAPRTDGSASHPLSADALPAADTRELISSVSGLLGSSPQPICVVELPAPGATGPTPGPRATNAAESGPAVAACAPCVGTASAAAAEASDGPCGAGSNSPQGYPAAFTWAAYAMLPADSTPSASELGSGELVLAAEAEAPAASAGLTRPAVPPASVAPDSAASPPPHVISVGALGEVLYANEAVAKLFGYSLLQLQTGGLGLLALRPPGAAAAAAAAGAQPDKHDSTARLGLSSLAAALASGSPASLEMPCYHSSGRQMWCSLAVSAMGPGAGPAAGVADAPLGLPLLSGQEIGCGERRWRSQSRSRGGRSPCGVAAIAAGGCGNSGGNTSCSSSTSSLGCSGSPGLELRRAPACGAPMVRAGAAWSSGSGSQTASSAPGMGTLYSSGSYAAERTVGSTRDGEGISRGEGAYSSSGDGGHCDSITNRDGRGCKGAVVTPRVGAAGGPSSHPVAMESRRALGRSPREGAGIEMLDHRKHHQQQQQQGQQQRQPSEDLALADTEREQQLEGRPLLDVQGSALPEGNAPGMGTCCKGLPVTTQQQYEHQQQLQRQQQEQQRHPITVSVAAPRFDVHLSSQQGVACQGQLRTEPQRRLLVIFTDVTEHRKLQQQQQQQQQQQIRLAPESPSVQQRFAQRPELYFAPDPDADPGSDPMRSPTPAPCTQADQRPGCPAHAPLQVAVTQPCGQVTGAPWPSPRPHVPLPLCLPSLLAAAGLARASATAPGTAAAAAAGPVGPGSSVAAAAAAAVGVGSGCAACQLHDFAMDSLREGITLADASLQDFPIVYTNQAFLSMTGYSREEVLGRNCRFLQGPDTDPAAVRAIRDAIRHHQGVTVQLVNYTKAGTRFWNELRLAPVMSPATGKLVAYIGIQSDVSELLARKQSEAWLRDAKEAAESATEAKSQFLANMSHEIRTPLNGMIATAQLLLSSVLTPEQRELTETILESGSTLVGILGDILDFSKIDHGSLELQRRPMCLRQTTEACIDLVAAEAAKKGLALAYLIDDEALCRPLLADPVRIRQVLANLLSNAVKFTERGEVVVRVTVEGDGKAASCEDEQTTAAGALAAAAPAGAASSLAAAPAELRSPSPPLHSAVTPAAHLSDTCEPDSTPGVGACGTTVHITVTDTGIGIDEDSARKLFQHFRQGSETMSRRYGGTGLGLAISKRLAQLMQGDIWVESRKGAGSTFHFTMQADWTCDGVLWPCSPARSPASTPSHSSDCTPRTSTDEGNNSGSAAAIAAAALSCDPSGAAGVAGSGAAAAAASCAARSSSSSLYTSTATRLSSGSSGSGRGGQELRTSPWMPDGMPREGGGEACDSAGGAAAAVPPSPPAPPSASGHRSSCGGGSSSGQVGGADGSEERVALMGRTILVDVSHAATSAQVCNSCRQLGVAAVQGNACALPPCEPSLRTSVDPPQQPSPAIPIANPNAALLPLAAVPPATAATSNKPSACATGVAAAAAGDGAAAAGMPAVGLRPPQPCFDVLVVSIDRLVPALKSGWKGRPVVALGDREQLPANLQPLVVALAVPVRHHRLATALVKATALLRWNGSSAPKLANTPIPSESIQTLKSWRLKRGPDWEGLNRRTSLDNSALERTVMARFAGAAAGSGTGACRSSLGTERSPLQQQQAPIPEHAELSSAPDDLPPSSLAVAQMAAPGAVGPSLAPCQTQEGFTAQAPAASEGSAPQRSLLGAAAEHSGGAGAAATGQQNLEQLRILIAEDNKVNQKVVLKVLQQILRGCQPLDVVENGLQVLQALQKKTYDLILMDIHMPEMDGLEASKRIQETYKPAERPRIIALSADTVQTLHDRCREAGIEAFLVKPFRIEELARVMRRGAPRMRNPLDPEPCGAPMAV